MKPRLMQTLAAASALAIATTPLLAQTPPATPVNCNEAATATLAGAADRVLFEFPAARQTRVAAAASPIAPSTDPSPDRPTLRVTLMSSAGAPLASGEGTLAETVLQDDGVYTLAVEVATLNGAADGPIDFSLNVTCSAGPPNIPPPPPPPPIPSPTASGPADPSDCPAGGTG